MIAREIVAISVAARPKSKEAMKQLAANARGESDSDTGSIGEVNAVAAQLALGTASLLQPNATVFVSAASRFESAIADFARAAALMQPSAAKIASACSGRVSTIAGRDRVASCFHATAAHFAETSSEKRKSVSEVAGPAMRGARSFCREA